MGQGRARSAARILVVVLLAVVVAEASAALALAIARVVRPSRFTIPRGYFEERIGGDARLRARLAEPGFDATLGWQPVPGSTRTFTGPSGAVWTARYDADGARRDELNATGGGPARIAAFGDSFTHGDEVEDDQTWEHELAILVDAPVRNFGVGAYGTDQAVLRLERQLDEGLDVEIVVLGIHEENVNRIVNRYRPYYLPTDPLTLGFKSRFVLDGDVLRLVPNPLNPTRHGPPTVGECLDDASHDDYWFARNADRPQLAPPFTYQLLKLALDVAAEKELIGANPLASLPRDAWLDPGASRLMTALVERFASVAHARAIMPVLLVLPDLGNGTSWDGTTAYQPWLAELRRNPATSSLVVVDMAERIGNGHGFRVRSDGGHASVEGNRQIARALAERIRPLLGDHMVLQRDGTALWGIATLGSTIAMRSPVCERRMTRMRAARGPSRSATASHRAARST